jgi:hypothetical protein
MLPLQSAELAQPFLKFLLERGDIGVSDDQRANTH